MKSGLYVGIDPGVTGAIAVVDSHARIVSIQDTPTVLVKKGKTSRTRYVESAMVDAIEGIAKLGAVEVVALENVHAMKGQGVTSMFSMGDGFGLWRGILAALRVPFYTIEPRSWKSQMGIVSAPAVAKTSAKGNVSRGGADKGASVVRALQLYPSCADLTRDYKRKGVVMKTMLHGRADALLLARTAALHPR